jgi:DNA mismatch repair protein MutS2
MTNIIQVLQEADPRSLVLLDELGAGTDPDEGSALAMALLDNLRDRGITTLATTHYSDLKLYAHNTPGVRNASVEFDVESLSPTFELSIGLPGRSNALTIAGRLGLNPVIVENAEKMVRPDSLAADSLLDDIRRVKQETQRIAEENKERERQLRVQEADLRYQLARMEEARRTVIAEIREIMQAELAETRQEIEKIRRRLARGSLAAGNALDEFLSQAQGELVGREKATQDQVERDVTTPDGLDAPDSGSLDEGDLVWVPKLQATGEILTVSPKGDEAEVQVGNFRLKLPVGRLELRQKRAKEPAPAKVKVQAASLAGGGPGMELDLRGERVEAGLARLDRYLDDAYLSNLPWVRIIHGKGTGAMRDAVREQLRNHPLVSKYRTGELGEGGDGVTVANLVQSES